MDLWWLWSTPMGTVESSALTSPNTDVVINMCADFIFGSFCLCMF